MENKRLLRWYHYLGAVFLLVVIVVVLGISNSFKQQGNLASSTPTIDGHDLIVVDAPLAGSQVTSPVHITGQARGNWYFEATFPVVIVDWDGRIIGQGHATAKSDWMTTEYVPFDGTIDFTRPADLKAGTYNARGAVIFKKDNPSGDPARDAAVEVPVIFQ